MGVRRATRITITRLRSMPTDRRTNLRRRALHPDPVCLATCLVRRTTLAASLLTCLSVRLNFKSSPFHTILESLTPIVECPGKLCSLSPPVLRFAYAATLVMDKNRYNVDTTLKLQRLTVDRLKADATLRIMVYCAADNGLGAYTKLDIAFPHQVELKVNSDDVKANLRGLKNKPGSTRPADITHHLHKTDKYQNIVSLGYALTQKVRLFELSLCSVGYTLWVSGAPLLNECRGLSLVGSEIPLCSEPSQDTSSGGIGQAVTGGTSHHESECHTRE